MYPGTEREGRTDVDHRVRKDRRYEAETRLIEIEAWIRVVVVLVVLLLAAGAILVALTQRATPWTYTGIGALGGSALLYLGRRPSVAGAERTDVNSGDGAEKSPFTRTDLVRQPGEINVRRGSG